jgi:acyl carrier protein
MQKQTEANITDIEEIVGRFALKRHDKVPITRETRLIEDLAIDSPRMIDIVLELEDRFDVCLEDVEVQATGTVGDLIDLVGRRRLQKAQ